MAKDGRKSNRIPQPPKQEEGVSVRFQARLHSERPGEGEAIEILQEFREHEWKDRDLLREMLYALKRQVDEGWQPVQDITPITLNDALLGSIEKMVGLAQDLANIDLSAARNRDGSAVDHEQLHKKLTEFDQSAARLVGDVRFFDDEDDD